MDLMTFIVGYVLQIDVVPTFMAELEKEPPKVLGSPGELGL